MKEPLCKKIEIYEMIHSLGPEFSPSCQVRFTVTVKFMHAITRIPPRFTCKNTKSHSGSVEMSIKIYYVS